MQSGTSEQQQEAAAFLESCKNSPNSLITISSLLTAELSFNSKFQILCMILHIIQETWFKYNREVLNQVKELYINFLFNNSLQNLISTKLEQVIAQIAFYDYPENWEDFIPFLINFLSTGREDLSSHVFMILTYFLYLVNSSSKISLKRRSIVLEHFMTQIPNIFIFMKGFLSSEEVVTSFIEFSKIFCNIIADNSQISLTFSHFFFDHYVTDSRYTAPAIEAMTNLLSQNSSHLITLIPNLVDFISRSQQPIPIEFHNFLCNYIKNILISIPTICDSDESIQKIQRLFEVTLLAAPLDTFSLSFWELWNDSIHFFMSSQALFSSLLLPLIPLAVTTFCELLPSSTELSRFISPITPSAFLSLYKISPEPIIDYMTKMQPSCSLCYAIGIIKHPIFTEKLLQIMNECSKLKTPDITIISAIFFALSRNEEILQQNVELLNSFRHLFSLFLVYDNVNENPDFQTTALLALNHVASKSSVVITNDPTFVEYLFNIIINPNNFTEENFHRICRIISKVILSLPINVRQMNINRITNFASSFLLSDNPNSILLGSQIVFSLSSISMCGSYLINKNFWMPLINAMKISMENDCFSDLAVVFASSMRGAPWGMCKKPITKFLKLVSNAQPIHCNAIVNAFNQLSQCHYELLDYRDQISSTFVRFMLDDPQPPFFEFFTICGLNEEEEGFVIPKACQCLPCPSLDLSKSASTMLRTMIRKTKNPKFFENYEQMIIHALFATLFDEMHFKMLKSLAKLLLSVYKKHIRTNTLGPITDQFVTQAVCQFVGDNEVSKEFAIAIREVVNNGSSDEFLQIVSEFMISSGRYNPEEMRILRNSLIQKTIAKELMDSQINEAELSIENEDEYVSPL
ncbi:hypothetical protein GPJ56_001150 [Histomonas meleagridis]|uniref:uncharacterized protein n=1 Tax=Histomonas meleagridis TaxID=135588 RepID=UPI0035597D1C|nr:hypothetical protein GPJ56_001150 [Histomonas meleagridis]KAH0799887.1 hypothetical protein GO595_006999 [Histomonas meleagridis]